MAPILLVEDDPHLILLYRRFLQEAGFLVLAAATGQEAMQLLEQKQVCLIITDLLMPDGDGFELMRMVHNRFAAVPVIAITGGGRFMSSQFLLDSARTLGARKVLHKPFSADELLQSVLTVLQEAEQTTQLPNLENRTVSSAQA
ncbi:MAG: response regulator [Magnetococcales bacterium]|nr:response regulator [Magnetococcales bacterium]